MKIAIELHHDDETKIVVDSLKWHYLHGEDTPKMDKAFRNVLKYYMTHEEWKEFKRESN